MISLRMCIGVFGLTKFLKRKEFIWPIYQNWATYQIIPFLYQWYFGNFFVFNCSQMVYFDKDYFYKILPFGLTSFGFVF